MSQFQITYLENGACSYILPLNIAAPLDGVISPVIMLNVVVLPAPLIPNNPKH